MGYQKTTDSRLVNHRKFIKALAEQLVFEHSFNRGANKRRARNRIKYANVPIAFDLETSQTEQGTDNWVPLVYLWTISAQLPNGQSITSYGRTLDQFVGFLDQLKGAFNLNAKQRLVLYAHNLPYDFSYIQKAIHFTEVFAIRSKRALRTLGAGAFEFRCSAEIAKCKLQEWTKDSPFPKLVGNIDHSKIRYPTTALTQDEMQYAIHDTAGLAWRIEKLLHDNPREDGKKLQLADVPHTSTGFPRRSITQAFEGTYGSLDNNRSRSKAAKLVKNCHIDPHMHMVTRDSMAGGYTAINPNYIDVKLRNVKVIDACSQYPSMMMKKAFPIETFKKCTSDHINTLSDLMQLMENECVQFEVTFHNLKTKTLQAGYLSEHRDVSYEGVRSPWVCNGKIMKAEVMTIATNDVEFLTILDAYTFESIEVSHVMTAKRGFLPRPLIELILKAYADKTILKGVTGQERFYMIAKQLINSLFGISATDVFRDSFPFDEERGQWADVDKFSFATSDVWKICEKENKRSNRYVYYPWGPYITALGRRELWGFIQVAGSNFVYCDTDSLMYLESEAVEHYLVEKNKAIVDGLKQTCAVNNLSDSLISPQNQLGERITLGLWEVEKNYEHFKAIASKRYLSYTNGKWDMVSAGVRRETGGKYIEKLAGDDIEKGFECFAVGLVIPYEFCGRLVHRLVEKAQVVKGQDYLGKSYEGMSLGGTVLLESSYTMSREDRTAQYLDSVVYGGGCYYIESY